VLFLLQTAICCSCTFTKNHFLQTCKRIGISCCCWRDDSVV